MQKTIYVRDEDLPLFEKAEKLGSVSQVIRDALAAYVEREERRQAGFETIELEVGRREREGAWNDTRTITFEGRLLAQHRANATRNTRGTDVAIYQGPTGRFLVWWSHWSLWQGAVITSDYAILDRLPEFEEEIQGRCGSTVIIPGPVLEAARAQAGLPKAERLDI